MRLPRDKFYYWVILLALLAAAGIVWGITHLKKA
jgi:hypothetical protein